LVSLCINRQKREKGGIDYRNMGSEKGKKEAKEERKLRSAVMNCVLTQT
jgi:hypothetical protein